MMLDTKEESLNTLRVASDLWPGLVYYQGVTTRTTLTTADKATQTKSNRNIVPLKQPSIKVKKKEGGVQGFNKRKEDLPENNKSTSLPSKCDPELKNKNITRKKCNQRSCSPLQCSTPPTPAPEESSQAVSQKQGRSSNFEKKLLPLPNVSWNELSRVEEGKSPTQLNASWMTFPHRIPRPHTAGPRVIVPPKHSCPVGLTETDVIRGRRFCIENLSGDDHCKYEQKNEGVEEKGYLQKQNWERKNAIRDDNTRISSIPSRCKDKECDLKVAALELTITSIQPEVIVTNIPTAENNDTCDFETPYNEKIRPKGQEQNSYLPFSAHNFNTIEGIRKSYRRAQSAPPTHERSNRIYCSSATTETLAQSKQFSNLYWRAKSAYHRRLEAAAASEDESDDNNKGDKSQGYPKHTLLRPLLRAEGEIKHGAGCPYKCKGCFKACLVSDDYVQKAIAKAAQESENTTEPPRETTKTVNRIFTKPDLVREALGRCQPLFQQVYGGGKVGKSRIKIRPWPRYGWMDLKANKEEDKKTIEDDENED